VRDIRAARAATTSGEVTWTVVGVDGLPITEVDQFLHWLRGRGSCTHLRAQLGQPIELLVVRDG
jgi:hypothetical protein